MPVKHRVAILPQIKQLMAILGANIDFGFHKLGE